MSSALSPVVRSYRYPNLRRSAATTSAFSVFGSARRMRKSASSSFNSRGDGEDPVGGALAAYHPVGQLRLDPVGLPGTGPGGDEDKARDRHSSSSTGSAGWTNRSRRGLTSRAYVDTPTLENFVSSSSRLRGSPPARSAPIRLASTASPFPEISSPGDSTAGRFPGSQSRRSVSDRWSPIMQ